jgi:hypothetical protein
MIGQGLSMLVQSNPAVAAIAVNGGGYLNNLTKGQALPSWTYTWVSTDARPGRHLQGSRGLTFARVQIDCFGAEFAQGADSVALSEAIKNVLDGYRGKLTDPNSTIVDSIFLSDEHDPEPLDPAGRTWRRWIEFEVNYVRS